MRRNQIQVGHFYTSSQASFARQIVEIEDETVTYHDYSLSDGSPILCSNRCSIATLASWAARECSQAEQARLDLAGMERLYQQKADEITKLVEEPYRRVMFQLLEVIGLKYCIQFVEGKGLRVRGLPPRQ